MKKTYFIRTDLPVALGTINIEIYCLIRPVAPSPKYKISIFRCIVNYLIGIVWQWILRQVIQKPLYSCKRYRLANTRIQEWSRNEEATWIAFFWACVKCSFCIVRQSGLPYLTVRPWITDFQCWITAEVAILGADEKEGDRWVREPAMFNWQ